MPGLSESTCVPCRGGVPPLTAEAIAPLLAQVPLWKAVTVGGVPRLRRELRFPDFRSALGFAVLVGLVAEREDHHPDLHVAWGSVTIETWTHKISGLHENDFILAAKIDRLSAAPTG
jgi:4a-hydroxytetrahydrobiopterin dehydratase